MARKQYDEHTTGSELVCDFADDIKGKTILVTGVTQGGIGAGYVAAVARADPSLIILAGRSESAVQKSADAVHEANPAVRTKTLIIDLGSFASVRAAAAEVNDAWTDVPVIDILVNNAGIMAVPWGKTVDGFERQFGTNYLGHFLLTNLLMPKILASKTPRVVVVSSSGHRFGLIRWGDINYSDGKCYNKWAAYGQSKSACNLFAVALAAKLGGKGLQAFSLHPGVQMTNLGTHLDWSVEGASLKEADVAMGNRFMHDEGFELKSDDEIIATSIYASFTNDLREHNGVYLNDCRIADQCKEEVFPWSTDPIEAKRLWTLTEKLVGQEFKY